jgi:hypothetical protein
MSRQIKQSGSPIGPNEIEDSFKIDQSQLNNAKIYSCREEYAKTLSKGIRYMEVGVAWGYSVELFAGASEAQYVHLIDWFNQDLMCWSWRKFGSCKCNNIKHELLYTKETHQQYIINKFSKYNLKTSKGEATEILKNVKDEYDFIYIDITNGREVTKQTLSLASRLVPVGGIIGLNDYLIYDGIIEDEPYGTFQTVNEFLHINKNWEVQALALHPVGFYDIYIKRVL